MSEKLIIANCSGFFGDRLSAAKEMVEGGHIDVLTGDYLAELTMALLFRMKLKDPDKGYASTFLKQMEQVMGLCLEKNIKVVVNAGGLNPKGLAKALETLSETLGLKPVVGCIEGDDLMPGMASLQEKGESFTHIDKGISLKDANANPLTANAYLGGWGITKALNEGADIVVGGRIADASLISGPCAWKFNWKKDDWDRLAGAYVAGHIIECGAQATGGNYSFFEEVPSFKNVGFPIAEMNEDGSFIITKHTGTGGLVSTGSVTAQLMYEINEPVYLTPDVKVHFDTINIEDYGDDRVYINGTKGEPPTGKAKVCINNLYGYKNAMTVILTGLDIEKKAKLVETTVFELMGGKETFAECSAKLVKTGHENPKSNDEAFSYLHITVLDPDQRKVARLSSALIELALSNIPGFTLTAPPSKGTPAIQHWPALISGKNVNQKLTINGNSFDIGFITQDDDFKYTGSDFQYGEVDPEGVLVDIPLGRVYATRSGDKGGNANLGVWGKTVESYTYLKKNLTVEKLKELLPDMEEYVIDRYEFPNLKAINFYIRGVLGDGVAASLRSDPQGKTLGEYLRVKVIEVPESLTRGNF
ncbi:MAG: DUF1446 domain-containing protein [Desulfobacterales bacterium]|nr:DUF1446 domain-containing protein [Desulfobacterales bacterium]